MEINITQASSMMTEVLKAKLVPMITSSPGIGKSDIVKQLAENFNLKLIDFRLAQCDPTDLNGFPSVNKEQSRSFYSPPGTFPLDGDPMPLKEQNRPYSGWLLFFDEMNAAPLAVQAAAYKIILDRQVGEHQLHKNVAMVCAGNKATDKAIVNRMSTAMQSRLIHFELEADSTAWIKWAEKNDIDFRIRAFIGFRPELLHKFDPKHSDNTFPCP